MGGGGEIIKIGSIVYIPVQKRGEIFQWHYFFKQEKFFSSKLKKYIIWEKNSQNLNTLIPFFFSEKQELLLYVTHGILNIFLFFSAFLSVSDKSGIVEFAKSLSEFGLELVDLVEPHSQLEMLGYRLSKFFFTFIHSSLP